MFKNLVWLDTCYNVAPRAYSSLLSDKICNVIFELYAHVEIILKPRLSAKQFDKDPVKCNTF